MSLKETIQRLRPGLRLPVRNAVIAAAAVAVISLFVPNRYTSESQILPRDLNTNGTLSNLMATAAALGVNVGGAQGDDSASYVDILNSRSVADTVLGRRYDFGLRPLFFLSPRPQSMTLYDYLDEKNQDLAIEKFGKKVLNVDRDLKSGLITVDVTTDSPELSKQVLDLAIHELDAFIQASGQREGKAKADFSEKRLAEATVAAKVAEDRLEQFGKDHRNYPLSPDAGVRLEGLRLESELALRRQVVATLTLSLEQAVMDAKNDTPVLNILDHANLPIQKSWPSRSLWAVAALILGFLFSFVWQERDAVKSFLLERPAR